MYCLRCSCVAIHERNNQGEKMGRCYRYIELNPVRSRMMENPTRFF
jgi:hypothetical protein